MPDEEVHRYPQYAILSGDNMTSFDKVFYFLFKKSFNGFSIVELSEESDFWDEFYDLINSSSTAKCDVSIPQFDGIHCYDGQKMSFEAQTFNLEVLSSSKEMGDYYEGKMFYSQNITIRDLNSHDVFNISIDYLNDFLTDACINSAQDPSAKKTEPNLDAVSKEKKTIDNKIVIEIPTDYQDFSDVFYYLFGSNRSQDEYFIELEKSYDDIYDLTHEPYSYEFSFNLPEFEGVHCKEGKRKKFKSQDYTFKVNKSYKKMIDYCEGKAQYDYVTEIEDCLTQDKFSIVLSYFNDSMIDVGIY